MPHSSLGQLSPSEVQSCWNVAMSNRSRSFPFRPEPKNSMVQYDASVYSGFHENNDKDMFFQKLDLLPSSPKRKRSSSFRSDTQAPHIAPAPFTFPQLLKDGTVRSNIFMFELTSIFGKKLIEEWSAFKLDQLSIENSVSKYERFCDGAFIGGSSKLQYFRSRLEGQFPVTHQTDRRGTLECHTYCFTRSQKLERRLVLQTGLTRRSRILKRLCKNISVKLHRLSAAEIKKYISEQEALHLGLPGRECAVRVRRLSSAECQDLIDGIQPSRPSFSLTGKEIEIDGKVVIDLCSDDESDEVVVLPKRSVLAETSRLTKNGSPGSSRHNSLSKYDESSLSALRNLLTTPKKLTPTKSLVTNIPKSYNSPVFNGHNSTSSPSKRNGMRSVPHCQVSFPNDVGLQKGTNSAIEANTQRIVSSCVRNVNLSPRDDLKQANSSNRVGNFSNGIPSGALSALTAMDSDDVNSNGLDASYASKLPDACHKQALPSGALNDSPVQKIKNKIAGMLRLTKSNNVQMPLQQKVLNYLKTQFVALASDELTILPLPMDNCTSTSNGKSDGGKANVPERCEIIPYVNSNGMSSSGKQSDSSYPKLGAAIARKIPERAQVSKSNSQQPDVSETKRIPHQTYSANPYAVSARSPISGVDADIQLSSSTTGPSQMPSSTPSIRQRLRSSRDQQDNTSESSFSDVSSLRNCKTRSMSTSPQIFERQSSDTLSHQYGPKTRPAPSRAQAVTSRNSPLKTDLGYNISGEKQQPLLKTPLKGPTRAVSKQSAPGRLSKGSPMTPDVKIGFKCHVCGFAKFFSHDSQSAINDHIISKHGGFDKVTLVRNARRPVDCVLYNAFLTKNLSSLNNKHRKLKYNSCK